MKEPSDYPPESPFSDPWHHVLCVCGHKRAVHYDEHDFCVACSDGRRNVQVCEQFTEAASPPDA